MPLLPIFYGMDSKNPYSYIREFEEVYNTFKEKIATVDLMRLKLFPFTLKDKAKFWLKIFPFKDCQGAFETGLRCKLNF